MQVLILFLLATLWIGP